MASLNNAKTAADRMASKLLSRHKRSGFGRSIYYSKNADEISADLEVFSIGLTLAN